MICRKCRGRMMYDSVYSENKHIEVYCLRCGMRKMVDKEKNPFGRWLAIQVLRAEHALN